MWSERKEENFFYVSFNFQSMKSTFFAYARKKVLYNLHHHENPQKKLRRKKYVYNFSHSWKRELRREEKKSFQQKWKHIFFTVLNYIITFLCWCVSLRINSLPPTSCKRKKQRHMVCNSRFLFHSTILRDLIQWAFKWNWTYRNSLTGLWIHSLNELLIISSFKTT